MNQVLTEPRRRAAVTPDSAASSRQHDEGRPLSVRTYGMTDRGLVRPNNEDQFLIAVLTKALQVHQTSLPQPALQYGTDPGYLFLVADGMGGHRGGEQASARAVDFIERVVLDTFQWLFQLQGNQGQDVLAEFQAALRQTDTSICMEAKRHPELEGMGTTVTMAYSFHRDLFVAHVGDSRCYLFRDGELLQLTHDHTLVEDMVHQGLLRSEEARHHHWRHVITNVVGGPEPGVKPEIHKVGLQEGDVMLLCSDGLTDMVPDTDLGAIVAAETDPKSCCERLLAQAMKSGGRDNVTAIVARFEAPAG